MNQSDLLEYLRERGQATAPEIVRDTNCNADTLYKKLNQLCKFGYIVKIEGRHNTIWKVIQ